MDTQAVISIFISLVGFITTIITVTNNMAKGREENAKDIGKITTMIEGLKTTMDELKHTSNDMNNRLIALETKQGTTDTVQALITTRLEKMEEKMEELKNVNQK